jgi:hypothetical protein
MPTHLSQKVFYAALTTTVQVVKTGLSVVTGWMIYNPNATIAYVQLFDLATTVTLGTTVPTLSLPIPAGASANLLDGAGIAFDNGIQVACTTTATGSTAPSTGLDVNIFYL